MKTEVTNPATVRRWVAGYDLDRRVVWPESSSPTHVPTLAVRGAGRRPRRDPTDVGGRSGRLTGLSWPPRSFAVEGPRRSFRSRSDAGSWSARNTATREAPVQYSGLGCRSFTG